MAGAMAGSAVLEFASGSSDLNTVTMTVNNTCNLACPHCYLQHDGPKHLASDEVVGAVLSAPANRICIVGKEPYADSRSAKLTSSIVLRAASQGWQTSVVTNGLNLSLMSDDDINALTWIDVSLDAGREGYEAFRGGSLNKLLKSIERVNDIAPGKLRVLFTVCGENVSEIDGMVTFADELSAAKMIFSPFQSTRSSGDQLATMMSPSQYVDAMAASRVVGKINAYVTLDGMYLRHFMHRALMESFVISAAHRLRVGDRFIGAVSDPIEKGVIRIGYDGTVLTPFESVDTVYYVKASKIRDGYSVATAFAELQAKHVAMS